MSSSAVMAPAPAPASPHPTSLHNYLLLAGGYFSLAFAAFQVSAIGWSPSAVRYFGGPADLRIERPILYALLCLAVGAIVAVFGVYALSGAGKIRRMPLLRTVLISVTAIYLLRGLLFIPQLPVVLKHPGLCLLYTWDGAMAARNPRDTAWGPAPGEKSRAPWFRRRPRRHTAAGGRSRARPRNSAGAAPVAGRSADFARKPNDFPDGTRYPELTTLVRHYFASSPCGRELDMPFTNVFILYKILYNNIVQ